MAHLERVPNLGKQERTGAHTNVTDSQCLCAARCKRRPWKRRRRRKGGEKKLFVESFCALLLPALCAAGVTAGPGVSCPPTPRAVVPSAHSAAPKAQRLQQHNTITATQKKKIQKKKIQTP